MTRSDVETWIGKNIWPLGLIIIWAVSSAALIAQKAEKSDVVALRDDVNTLLYLACRDATNARDSRCSTHR